MPTFGESPSQAQKRPEARELERKVIEPTQPLGGLRDEFGRPNAVHNVAPSPKTKVSPFSSPKQANLDSLSVYAGDLTSPSPFPESPSQDQLLQGVVWAEILGPQSRKALSQVTATTVCAPPSIGRGAFVFQFFT